MDVHLDTGQTQDTETLGKGTAQANQDQAEFNLGYLRLAKFLVQLSPPGTLDEEQ